ncbi:MAG: rod shape-determining protein MreC [Clostridia bacterium]|nr:rod shape-determining protein MreC [Clostridia bacterium]
MSTITSGYTSTFTINRGSIDGIEVGDCVMTDAGFVGYISSVALRSAEVITLINIDTKLACIVSRTRETVVVEGDFVLASDGCLKMPYLKNDVDLQTGDIIETSGATELFPKGIIVGTVKAVRREDHGISSYAVIEPAVDIEKLHTVFVVKDFEITE